MNTGFLGLAVATVLTACGIETDRYTRYKKKSLAVATVLTACGIETFLILPLNFQSLLVATVLTACGIETRIGDLKCENQTSCCNSSYRLRY